MLADQFAQICRDEHRKVRDTLLVLVQAFQDCDKTRIRSLLNQVATCTGPHFRYEEESLYPALSDIYGGNYIEQLLSAHDRAIGTASKLVELAGKEPLADENIAEAKRLIQTVLPHVSDCEGLSLMVERLPEEKVRSILKARDSARRDGLDLVQWASRARNRPAVAPSYAEDAIMNTLEMMSQTDFALTGLLSLARWRLDSANNKYSRRAECLCITGIAQPARPM